VAEDRPLVEQVLDTAFYAPIGAIVIASEQVPALVERGRALLESRVVVARMVGRMAVATARRRVSDVVASNLPSDHEPETAREGPEPRLARAVTLDAERRADRVPGADLGPRPEVESLAIPGYDSLAASQVVQRLAGLTAGELESVRRYELSTRGRRTILGRVAQLQGDADAAG
jgi:hypothetical protein